MTPATHLALIRARCVKLLEIAKGRTKGRWNTNNPNLACVVDEQQGSWVALCDEGYPINRIQYNANADFIAACAGPAECAWCTTIAAIDAILDTKPEWEWVCEDFKQSILAAWPLEELE